MAEAAAGEDMVVEVVTAAVDMAAVDMAAVVADLVEVEGDLEAVVVGLEAVALVALVAEDLVDLLEAAVSEVVAMAVDMADTDPLDTVVWDWASCLCPCPSLTPADVPIHMDMVTTMTTTMDTTANWRSEK